MKEPYPVPLHIIFNHLSFLELPRSSKASVINIIYHLWRRGFDKMLSDTQLKEIGLLSNIDWVRHSESIKESLAQILPELRKRYEKVAKIRNIHVLHLNKAWKERKRLRNITKNHNLKNGQLFDKNPVALDFTPLSSPHPFNDGKSDKQARSGILEKNEQLSGNANKKQFTDG